MGWIHLGGGCSLRSGLCNPGGGTQGALGYVVFQAATVETKLLLLTPLPFQSSELELAELHCIMGLDFCYWSDSHLSEFSVLRHIVKVVEHINQGVEDTLIILACHFSH